MNFIDRMGQQRKHLLGIDLKEVELVFAQCHVRMQNISNLTMASVALAGAVLAGIEVLGEMLGIRIFLFIPLPFYLFALLTLREDMLMAVSDAYYYKLRSQILAREGLPKSSSYLNWLQYSTQGKVDGFARLLSGLRYGVPIGGVFVSLCWFWLHTEIDYALSREGIWNAIWLSLNFVFILLFLYGLRRLITLHASLRF